MLLVVIESSVEKTSSFFNTSFMTAIHPFYRVEDFINREL